MRSRSASWASALILFPSALVTMANCSCNLGEVPKLNLPPRSVRQLFLPLPLPETIYFLADSGRYRSAMGVRQRPVHFQGGFRQAILGAQDEYGFIRTDARDLYIAIFA